MKKPEILPDSRRKHKLELFRNLRIVSLRRKGMTYQAIANLLHEEDPSEPVLSRQRIDLIYRQYKDIPFYFEDDKIIIH